jgi:hypothetical protein
MMKQARLTIGLGLALGLLAGTVAATPPGTTGNLQAAVQPQLSRHEAVRQLVLKWGPGASYEQGVGIYRWADRMVPLFREADISNLNKALSAKSYGDMVMTLAGGKAVSAGKLANGVVAASLGSLSGDLVYTPLSSCILVDTRVTGGIMTGGTTRNYKASGPNFTAQGGSNTDCGIPAGVNALVVTVQSINATARGYFRMWPYGTSMPAASVMSYGATQNTQNNVVLATTIGSTADFSVQSAANSHLVVAVLGYFAAPVATALNCTEVLQTVSVSSGTLGSVFATCPAGYSNAGGGSVWGGVANAGPIYNVSRPGTNRNEAYGYNTTGAAVTLFSYSNCCRIPGR